jgi:hypothetical protein
MVLRAGRRTRRFEMPRGVPEPVGAEADPTRRSACNKDPNVRHRTSNAQRRKGFWPIYKRLERSESILRRSMLNLDGFVKSVF